MIFFLGALQYTHIIQLNFSLRHRATGKLIPRARRKPKYGQPSCISPLQFRGMRANDARASAPRAHFHANDNTTTTLPVLRDGRSRDRDRHSSYLLRAKLGSPPPAPSRCVGRSRGSPYRSRAPYSENRFRGRWPCNNIAMVNIDTYPIVVPRTQSRSARVPAKQASERSKRASALVARDTCCTRGLPYLDVSLASFVRFMRRDNGRTRETQWWPTRLARLTPESVVAAIPIGDLISISLIVTRVARVFPRLDPAIKICNPASLFTSASRAARTALPFTYNIRLCIDAKYTLLARYELTS